MIEKGRAAVLPDVSNWSSLNKGPVAQRLSFYEALGSAMEIPAVRVERVTLREDKYGRGADYLGIYPGLFVSGLPGVMSASVRFEVGRARVVPFVERPISSFVHDYLEHRQLIGEFADNRSRALRCVHPLVTLLEKLDALSKRYVREPMEADGFVRHYEDAARIVQSLPRLAPAGVSAMKLAQDMLTEKDIVALPSADDASLLLDDPAKRRAIELAYARIGPMFWGRRIALDDACTTICQWIDASVE